MNNKFLVYIINPLTNLPDNPRNIFLIHPPLSPQLLQKLPSSTELDQQINIFLIFEISIQTSNISMLEVKLDAQFSGDLASVVLLLYLLFLHCFYAAEPTGLFVASQCHLTKLPLAHFFPQGEITDLECGRLGGQGQGLVDVIVGIGLFQRRHLFHGQLHLHIQGFLLEACCHGGGGVGCWRRRGRRGVSG